MARLNFLTAACMLLVLLLGIVHADPVAANDHDAPGPKKKYVPKGNRLDCPAADGSKYTGPRGGKWGILCGYDTVSVTVSLLSILGLGWERLARLTSEQHQWGPFDLPFDQCIAKCGGMDGCFIAT